MNDYVTLGAVAAGFAALGAATMIGLEKAVTKYGHVFQHYNYQPEIGIRNAALLGLIGAVQIAASLFATVIVSDNKQSTARGMQNLVICNIITGVVLAGLTALAAKTNMIASQFTLFGGIMLVTNSAVTSVVSLYLLSKVVDD